MKNVYFFILIIVFLASCTGNTIYEKPDNLIPRDSMILLLTDMHIAGGARITKNKFHLKDINYMHYVYDKYKIDSVRFGSSNNYYASTIDDYDKMLHQIKANLLEKLTSIKEQISKSDSIKKAQKETLKLTIDSLKNRRKKQIRSKINIKTKE